MTAGAAPGGGGGSGGSDTTEYLVARIEDALARDPRVAEQGLRVAVVTSGDPGGAGDSGGAGATGTGGDGPPTVVVTGTVVAVARKAAIPAVVLELAPGATVRDETTTADYPEPLGAEEVR